MRASSGHKKWFGIPWISLMLVAAPQGVWGEPVTIIRNHGDPANRVNLVILGDGYTTDEMGKYATDVNTFIRGVFAQEPFHEYQRYINVYRVDVTSNESGADHPELHPPEYKDTALDATYNCAGIPRLICVDNSKVQSVLVSSLSAVDESYFVLVLVNDTAYGGSGGAVAVASLHPDVVEIVLHELGHSFGQLADEYDYPPPPCDASFEPPEANVTRETERPLIKWNLWIDPSTPLPTPGTADGVPGLYEGAKYCAIGLFRPTFNSKMRNLKKPFEQINSEQLVKRTYNFVSPIDSTDPAGSALTVASGGTKTFQVVVPSPLTHSLSIVWRVDGQVVRTGPSFALDSSPLTIGDHTVEVEVRDPTTIVLNDPGEILTGRHLWTVTVDAGTPTVSAANQYRADGVTPIPEGGITPETTVVFRATVADANGDQVRLQIELRQTTEAFTGTPTFDSGLLPSGSQAAWTQGGLVPAAYRWRYRAVDAGGLSSAWTEFGTAGNTDFTVAANAGPLAPTALNQYRSDGVTVLAVGGSTPESTVVFKGTVSDPDAGQQVKLQVELHPLATAFTGNFTHESSLVINGAVAQITVPSLGSGIPYHWRARTVDSLGAASPWVSFGGNRDSAVDFTVAANQPPTATNPKQYRSDGLTLIPEGGSTPENTLYLSVWVSDPNGDQVNLQIELRQTSEAFTGTPTFDSDLVPSGVTVAWGAGPLGNAPYKWRYRAVDAGGGASPWTEFGTPGNTDFTVAANAASNAPTGLNRFRSDGVTAIAVGGSTPETTVVFKGTVSDPDTGQQVKLQIELRPLATAFTGTFTNESSLVTNGDVAQITVPNLSSGTPYHWRARTVESNGAASAWVSFGGNRDNATDFMVASGP